MRPGGNRRPEGVAKHGRSGGTPPGRPCSLGGGPARRCARAPENRLAPPTPVVRKDSNRLLKRAHLRRWHAGALGAAYRKYTSLGPARAALHLGPFEQPVICAANDSPPSEQVIPFGTVRTTLVTVPWTPNCANHITWLVIAFIGPHPGQLANGASGANPLQEESAESAIQRGADRSSPSSALWGAPRGGKNPKRRREASVATPAAPKANEKE